MNHFIYPHHAFPSHLHTPLIIHTLPSSHMPSPLITHNISSYHTYHLLLSHIPSPLITHTISSYHTYHLLLSHIPSPLITHTISSYHKYHPLSAYIFILKDLLNMWFPHRLRKTSQEGGRKEAIIGGGMMLNNLKQ